MIVTVPGPGSTSLVTKGFIAGAEVWYQDKDPKGPDTATVVKVDGAALETPAPVRSGSTLELGRGVRIRLNVEPA